MNAGRLTVEPEAGKRGRKEFIGFPYRLYADEPRWVPPLRIAEAAQMDPRKNPWFEHGAVQHFLARRDGRVVGRIAAIENRRHNEHHRDRLGFFGFFDVEPDPEAANALVAAAREWVLGRGLVGIRGPVCYSTNDVCGVLIEGFEHRPAILMPWNRPDYDALLLGAGLVKAKDLVVYRVTSREPPPERVVRIANRALERGGISLRTLDMKRWETEIPVIRDVYNASWKDNWGFVPMTEAEFAHAAKDLKQIVDPRIFLIAEKAGRPVGFIGIVPDVNQALVGLDGRLFPFGLFRLLWRKRRIRTGRVMLLGILPEARGRGADAAFLVHAILRGAEAGYADGEAGWVLEDNERMRADIESIGAPVFKRLRLYETPGA